ncbi:MAG: hypothetical protein Q8K98_00825 [Bacteroidota bacterium]|nr:hypothetical protein [Bacteroidota bacterium]
MALFCHEPACRLPVGRQVGQVTQIHTKLGCFNDENRSLNWFKDGVSTSSPDGRAGSTPGCGFSQTLK